MRSRALEVETQLRRSAPVEGARYYYLGSESYFYLGSGSGVIIPRGITSAITLVLAVRITAAPLTHVLFPRLKYGPICVVRGELRVEKGKKYL